MLVYSSVEVMDIQIKPRTFLKKIPCVLAFPCNATLLLMMQHSLFNPVSLAADDEGKGEQQGQAEVGGRHSSLLGQTLATALSLVSSHINCLLHTNPPIHQGSPKVTACMAIYERS